ncbi:MAG: four helix bundle protein [Cyanosarcina radialis HA8281-LM2]|jgi:four helix bundle protein|nr:four helix bundle protein [Cyanosarcina radialis HA8281-LM2]
MNSEISIQDRSQKFAVRIVKAYIYLEKESSSGKIIGQQLLRSGTSIGANCQEAQSAQSKKDFIHKYEIAFKEARETLYWIEVIIEAGVVSREKLSLLQEECTQIIKILVASINKLKSPS